MASPPTAATFALHFRAPPCSCVLHSSRAALASRRCPHNTCACRGSMQRELAVGSDVLRKPACCGLQGCPRHMQVPLRHEQASALLGAQATHFALRCPTFRTALLHTPHCTAPHSARRCLAPCATLPSLSRGPGSPPALPQTDGEPIVRCPLTGELTSTPAPAALRPAVSICSPFCHEQLDSAPTRPLCAPCR